MPRRKGNPQQSLTKDSIWADKDVGVSHLYQGVPSSLLLPLLSVCAPTLSWPMVGTAVWSPLPYTLLPFWLQRAISCVKKRTGWEGAGAEVGLVVLALSLPSGSILPHFLSVFLSVSSPALCFLFFTSLSPLNLLLFGVLYSWKAASLDQCSTKLLLPLVRLSFGEQLPPSYQIFPSDIV